MFSWGIVYHFLTKALDQIRSVINFSEDSPQEEVLLMELMEVVWDRLSDEEKSSYTKEPK